MINNNNSYFLFLFEIYTQSYVQGKQFQKYILFTQKDPTKDKLWCKK